MNPDGSKFSKKKIVIVCIIGVLGWVAGFYMTGIGTIWSIPIGVACSLLPATTVHYLMN